MTHQQMGWEQILRQAGHRVTRQRGAILDAVCEGGGHTPIGEVYARAHRLDPTIDRSTVYRALKLFMDLNLVVAADTGDGETYFEIKHPQPHHHLICRECGAEQEIDDSVLLAMFEQVRSRHGFEVITDHLVLFGLCASCTARSARS